MFTSKWIDQKYTVATFRVLLFPLQIQMSTLVDLLKLLILFKFNLLFLTTVPVFISSYCSSLNVFYYYFNVSLTGQ